MSGPLEGVRVVELAHPHVEVAGKLLGCLGADVVLVEPTAGAPARRWGPFVRTATSSRASVSWAVNNVSKRSVALAIDNAEERGLIARLVATADVVLEGEGEQVTATHGLDRAAMLAAHPGLVWAAVTPFGAKDVRSTEPATDLTLAAAGGLVWSCGYDDHSLPPVRPAGEQALQTGATWAAIGILTALLSKRRTGVGQFVDVSIHAAVNVTTEQASYEYLVAGTIAQRQTGRHASASPTRSPYFVGADGRQVHYGVPPRSGAQYRTLIEWLHELGLELGAEEEALLERGAETGVAYDDIGRDPVATAIDGAGREAMMTLAGAQSGYDYFLGAQNKGLGAGLVYEPGEVLGDPHLVARDFAVTVDDPMIGPMRVPGAPFRSSASPWAISRPAPTLGQHNAEVLDSLK